MPTTLPRRAGALTLILLIMSVSVFHTSPARAQQSAAPTDGTLPPPPGDDDFPIYPSFSPATLTVGPSPGNQYANLQAAIDAARPGDTILLEAGQTFMPAAGNSFILRNKNTTSDAWITIRTSAPDASLPPEGRRITPAYANVMPKLQARFAENRFVVKTEQGAHHYRLLGIEITAPLPPPHPSNFNIFALVELGERGQWDINQVPRDLTIDRCYIHGNEELNLRNGISLHSARTNIINSHISDCHSTPAEGSESRAIWGSSGPGPYKIINNYLEAATENILFGGEATHFIPSDIEIRRNHLFKPLAWRASGRWSVKNLLELKQARRVTIDGNILEHCWRAGQVGFAVLFTVYGSDVIEDVTFTNNIVRHAAFGVQFKNDGARSKRITVRNNLFDDIDGPRWYGIDRDATTGHFIQFDNGMDGLTVDHNTVFHTGSAATITGSTVSGFVFNNN